MLLMAAMIMSYNLTMVMLLYFLKRLFATTFHARLPANSKNALCQQNSEVENGSKHSNVVA